MNTFDLIIPSNNGADWWVN